MSFRASVKTQKQKQLFLEIGGFVPAEKIWVSLEICGTKNSRQACQLSRQGFGRRKQSLREAEDEF